MIDVQPEDFDVGKEYQQLREVSRNAGAIVTFTGLVRDMENSEKLVALELEHYPGMTEKSLAAIVDQACQRWPLLAVRIIHRVGRLPANDQIVFVGVSSNHRAAAFDAANFLMDYLKTQAPFWKKAITETGEHWVKAKQKDQERAAYWQQDD